MLEKLKSLFRKPTPPQAPKPIEFVRRCGTIVAYFSEDIQDALAMVGPHDGMMIFTDREGFPVTGKCLEDLEMIAHHLGRELKECSEYFLYVPFTNPGMYEEAERLSPMVLSWDQALAR